MKRATCKVLYYISRTKILKDGTIPIYIRMTINGQRAEFGLQRSILEDQWDNSLGKVKGSDKASRELNSYLEFVKSNILLKKRELEESGKEVSAHLLKNYYLGIDNSGRTILGIFKEHNDKCRGLINKDFAPGTIDRYETCYRHLSVFIKTKFKREDLLLNEISPMFISDFEYFLKVTRSCCHNTATKYIKNFKKIIRIALANGWMKADPFANIKFHLDDVDLDYLNESELNALINKEFKIERVNQVRDVYLFCCFTGLAFVDVKSLCQDDIEEREERLWIIKRRQKTKNWCRIPLLAPAVCLLEKYKGHPQRVKTGLLLPVPSNQRMNAYLKEIADLVGIEKNLSTHTARHTFATTVTLANQVSIEVVSKMLGHSSINMTK
ncbi:MAG: site-specific integrase, partial [Bacteroidetes bacterium]|nr:site-specific integrase [Bacteroidota bacterium]